jgi:hypothetical protein
MKKNFNFLSEEERTDERKKATGEVWALDPHSHRRTLLGHISPGMLHDPAGADQTGRNPDRQQVRSFGR